MKEEWRDIPNYENLYQISNTGKINSLHNYRKNNILIPRIKKGYYTIGLRKNGKRKFTKVSYGRDVMKTDLNSQFNHF